MPWRLRIHRTPPAMGPKRGGSAAVEDHAAGGAGVLHRCEGQHQRGRGILRVVDVQGVDHHRMFTDLHCHGQAQVSGDGGDQVGGEHVEHGVQVDEWVVQGHRRAGSNPRPGPADHSPAHAFRRPPRPACWDLPGTGIREAGTVTKVCEKESGATARSPADFGALTVPPPRPEQGPESRNAGTWPGVPGHVSAERVVWNVIQASRRSVLVR